jgi:proprotein convertase subtilisin/kexin type 5
MQAVGQNASCVDQCPDGFYKLSVTECAPCNIECTTCQGAPNNCTSCLHGSVSVNGTCSVSCGENEFSFQGFCLACSESCYGCQFSPQNCLECAAGYVKTGSICQRGCLSYQFYDNNQKRCISCGPGCATCSSFNFCTTCSNPAITPRGGVCSNCPYPCATCDGTGACTTCLSGFYFFQGSCQTNCPVGASPINGVCQCASGIVSQGLCVTSCGSGFTAIAGSCQPCNSNCADCSGNVNSCTRCISGFTIDTTTRRCVAQAQCPYGQDLSNGVCTNICDSGFFFYEGICIYGGCFNGYTPNANGGCIRQTEITAGPQCNANQFISNGRCVGSCDNGFYPDSNTRRCLACSANCISCFNPSYCIICGTGFEMQNGVCVPSTTCSSNQFQYNGQCISSCPIGTYLVGSQCFRSCPDNNYYLSQICYLSCPTPLRTNEACVSQCPAGTTNSNGVCQ